MTTCKSAANPVFLSFPELSFLEITSQRFSSLNLSLHCDPTIPIMNNQPSLQNLWVPLDSVTTLFCLPTNSVHLYYCFPDSSAGKESTCNAGDLVRSLGREDPTEKETGKPLQCPCLEDPMNKGAWRAAVHWVSKELGTTEQLTLSFTLLLHTQHWL